AVDTLYTHFARKMTKLAPVLPESNHAAVTVREHTIEFEPTQPTEPGPGATDQEKATYYENLALWAHWQANQHAQRWRGQMEEWRGEVEAALEGDRAMLAILPELIERLGPEKISPIHRGQVQGYVQQIHTLTGKPYPTIYDDIRRVFGP